MIRRFALAAVFIPALLAVSACEDLSQEPDPPFDSDSAGQTIGGTRIVWAKGGRTSAVIRARVLQRFQERDEIFLRDSVEVNLYDDAGVLEAIVTGDAGVIDEAARTASVDSGIVVRFLGTDEYRASTLTAQTARANDRSKEVVATGSVSIDSESGVTLETEHLIWDGRRRRFSAPGFVRITTGTDVEEGTQLDANADLTEWSMQEIRGRTTRPVEELRQRDDDGDSAMPGH